MFGKSERLSHMPRINFEGIKNALGASNLTIPAEATAPHGESPDVQLPPAIVLDSRGSIPQEDLGFVPILANRGAFRHLEKGLVPPTETDPLGVLVNLAVFPLPDRTQGQDSHRKSRVAIPVKDFAEYTNTPIPDVRELAKRTPLLSIGHEAFPDEIKPEPMTEVVILEAADAIKAARDEAERHLLRPPKQDAFAAED